MKNDAHDERPSSRRGLWIPKACFWPLMFIFLIIILIDYLIKKFN